MRNRSKEVPQLQVVMGEILSDVGKSGKERKWKRYKEQSLAVSLSFFYFEELEKIAQNISSCGGYLKFVVCPAGHFRRLIRASFCRHRLCPMCQWRKSLVIFHQVLDLVHGHIEKYASDIPLLLTLTVPNVKADKLKLEIQNMQKAWEKLSRKMGFKCSIRSWFRSLEVTYNEKNDTYHPHYHVLLIVPKHYFERSRGLYISRDDWLDMWRETTGISEITQVDIRRVRKKSGNKSIEAVTAEVAKYATKPSTYLKEQEDGTFKGLNEVIKTLYWVLRGKRLLAFGGLFKGIRKELKQADIDKADLIQIEEKEHHENCPVCQWKLQEQACFWNTGFRQYMS